MKIKFEKFKRPATILGYFKFDMKYITAEIEYKYYIESNQLNLKLMNLQYKVKDKLKRVKHNNDYMKAFAQKFFKKKIKERLKKQIREVEESDFSKRPISTSLKIFWWESK